MMSRLTFIFDGGRFACTAVPSVAERFLLVRPLPTPVRHVA